MIETLISGTTGGKEIKVEDTQPDLADTNILENIRAPGTV